MSITTVEVPQSGLMAPAMISQVEAFGAPDVELSPQKLQSLGVLSPTAVDRLCANQSTASYLIDGFLRAKSVNIAAGDSGIGKSPLMCQLALCVASGHDFLGMTVKQGPVLYFDLENSLEDHKTMRDGIAQHLGLESAPGNFFVVPSTHNLNGAEVRIEAVRPSLVIIDSLRAFAPEVTERNREAAAWLNSLRNLARKYDCAFLIVHHLRKPGENSDGAAMGLELSTVNTWLTGMEGPRAFVNQTDTRVAIEGSADGLTIKWNRRLAGDSPCMALLRSYDAEGEPIGYSHPTGAECLSPENRTAFDSLSNEFRFRDAKATLGKNDKLVNDFLRQCIGLGILKKLPNRSGYRKLATREQVSAVSSVLKRYQTLQLQ